MSGGTGEPAVSPALSVRDRLVDGAYTAGWRLVRLLPERAARLLFQAGADLTVRRGGRGVEQLRRNLRRVAPTLSEPQLDDLVRRSMRSYLRYWREAFRLPAMDLRAVSVRVDAGVEGREHLDAALARGRGAIAVLPHSGNWDIAGVWAVSRYGGFTSVVERLRPEPLYRRFVAYRESMGFEILPHDGGRRMMSTLLARLRENRLLCLIADRDLSRRGVEVEFFGETTRMASGPARLAAATGAALVPAACEFTEDGWSIRLHEAVPVSGSSPAEIKAATQLVADAFAADIAGRPEDWHMLQPLWLADLSARRRALLAGDGNEAAGAPRVEGENAATQADDVTSGAAPDDDIEEWDAVSGQAGSGLAAGEDTGQAVAGQDSAAEGAAPGTGRARRSAAAEGSDAPSASPAVQASAADGRSERESGRAEPPS
ncbi:KDO2-lipid IV(A) lauroyltransferase [Actinoalloteichus hoggarensis]|uniref:Phosphatidylinositol mannoside acyltransferase n=1 Tax=Actinoalloteichus hoggarensis TaxID=1470176 RepID=A0A221W1K3_9PSEU|nr:Phosphatidylinositol mannoside acyltransferase [Actinoalloteichus hoggarensis]MBB5919629.1 KDO2-lipid IV(A) lauroyltransferase [Actinoalloteichus hoggarensis]